MEQTTQLDLRDVINDVLDTSGLTDPGDVSDRVIDTLEDRDLRDALRLTMRAYVRNMIGQRRALYEPPAKAENAPEFQSPSGLGSVSKSSKVQRIREGWRKHLRDRYHVEGAWVFLEAMSASQLLAAAQERTELAAQNIARANKLRDWAGLVEEHGVDSFGELPPEVLAKELG